MSGLTSPAKLVLGAAVGVLLLRLLAGCTPLPVNPGMRCKYDPKCADVDDEQSLTTVARDAGADR